MLKTDPVLKKQKLILFTEFADTARYLERELNRRHLTAFSRIDGGSSQKQRSDVIRRFSPYYNESSSAELAAEGKQEIRILITTDVLSEGLNLQDATRLINYDLHWNPVRLMQRIGRVDRRMNPEIEARMLADHPELKDQRGSIASGISCRRTNWTNCCDCSRESPTKPWSFPERWASKAANC